MPRTFAHHAQEGEGIEKGRQGKEGRLLLLLPQQSKKKKHKLNFKNEKGKKAFNTYPVRTQDSELI